MNERDGEAAFRNTAATCNHLPVRSGVAWSCVTEIKHREKLISEADIRLGLLSQTPVKCVFTAVLDGLNAKKTLRM